MTTQVGSLEDAIAVSRAIVHWLAATEPGRLKSAEEMAKDMLEYSANKYGERSTVDAAFASIALTLATLLTLKEFGDRANN